MQLKSCKKTYNLETQRAAPLEETLARIEPKVPAAGITRVADITNLDRIGIPVFSCIRPTAEAGSITVYNGKGATVEESRISAIMEGIERYSSELHDRRVHLAPYQEMMAHGRVLDPKELILPKEADVDRLIPWVEGFDIANNVPIIVPAHAVFHPLPQKYRQLFRTNTNGLASGNTMEEAVFHALSEVIERDAWSLVEASRDTGATVTNIDDPTCLEMEKKFADAQVEVRVRDITSDIGIPTMAAVADDVLLKDPMLLTIGIGTHTSARIAVMRALTEVAQSRLTQIHGAREDTTIADLRKKMGYDRAKRINAYWFKDNGTVDYNRIVSYDSDDFLTDIRFAIDALGKQGLDRVIVVDLTREEIGIPVVRVIVPGLEVYAMDPDAGEIGWIMQKIIVFLGPSLDRETAEKILYAEYCPPAKRGDLLAAVHEGATIIGLIDGVFHQESAVAHREILTAVRKGVRVIGSSSMGALRAAEMDTLGMVGIGEIYRMYKSGELESDDEVALVFDPSSGLAISEPLINIRFTLKRAKEEGIIDSVAYDALLASARALFYPNRTYRAIVSAAGETVDNETRKRFLLWVPDGACDQKKEDAVAALEYIRNIAGLSSDP